ncbi:MAG: MmgE/PrpD family protein [Actinomycetota bacterium]
MIERAAAEWAASFRFEDAPANVRETVESIFLDAIASGVAGSTMQLVRDVEPVARDLGGGAGTTFLAGYAITAATACDVYRPGLCHVTPVTVPPLLALAEDGDRDLLAALTVGLELTTRLLVALNYPRLRGRGWHAPGVAGPVGAAAAAARLLRLDARGVRNAMAHGALQSAGTFAALGTEAVKFTQARAAVAALLAASMARAGVAASDAWLTAEDGGLASTYTDDANPAALVAGLGDEWELSRISLRRWPAASSVQSLIAVCRLHAGPDAADIVSARIALSPGAYLVSGDRPWRTPLEAQQSARWVAATVLTEGDWWLDQKLGDPRIDALARRIEVVANDELSDAAVRIEIEWSDSIVRGERDTAPGDPEEPLTRAQIEAKLRQAAQSASLDADEILAAVEAAAYSKLTGLLAAVAVRA